MIPKKKTDDDVELGIGKAGLASMETLDDSLKDQDCVDKAVTKNNGTDDISKMKKAASGEIKASAANDEVNFLFISQMFQSLFIYFFFFLFLLK